MRWLRKPPLTHWMRRLPPSRCSVQGASCYPVQCTNNATMTIEVQAASGQAGGVHNVQCTTATAGQTVSVPGYTGSITCPDPVRFCGNTMKYNG